MSLQQKFLLTLGPGWFAGITLGDWLKLVARNGFSIDAPYWPRLASISLYAAINTAFRWPEAWLFDAKIRRTPVESPLFILGHPRSGTTHLHNLLSVDQRFATPNFFQVNYPHTFLTAEAWATKILQFFVPKKRFMDNMTQNMGIPYEEEWALCSMTSQSPYVGWSFPRRLDHYEKYLTLREVSEPERDQWKAALRYFVQKVSYKYNRPLILKSPPHTGRIKLLLELFPDAKFVHIHRDPYAVFQSTRHLWNVARPLCAMQRPTGDVVEDRIIRQYKLLYDAFFEERDMIPAGHYHEVCYEQLERNPIGEIEATYEKLGLPEFSQVRQPLTDYVAGLADYKKNKHIELDPVLKHRISQEWRRCFEEWGYATGQATCAAAACSSSAATGQCTCPGCGAPFTCGAQSGAPTCWCMNLPHTLPVTKPEAACFCPNCIGAEMERYAASRTPAPEACDPTPS